MANEWFIPIREKYNKPEEYPDLSLKNASLYVIKMGCSLIGVEPRAHICLKWLPQGVKFRTRLCVQLRQICSAGDSPVRVKARSPVAWIAGRRVTKSLKPIDKVTLGVMSKLSGRNESKRIGGLVIEKLWKLKPASWRRRQHMQTKTGRDTFVLFQRGDSDGMITRTYQAT